MLRQGVAGGAPAPAALLMAALALGGCLAVQGLQSPPDAAPLHHALVDEGRFPVLVVEVAQVEGQALDRSALIAFQQALSRLTGRASIAYTDLVALPPQGGNYTRESLSALHADVARVVRPGGPTAGGAAQLHVLVLDGGMRHASRDHLVLGTTLSEEGLLAVFPQAYAHATRLSGGVRAPATAELDRHVLLHELGHALGLVGRGVPMQRPHEDPANPGHSANPASVLHHRPPMELDGTVRGPPAWFDADDLADLAAYRARAGLPPLPASPRDASAPPAATSSGASAG